MPIRFSKCQSLYKCKYVLIAIKISEKKKKTRFAVLAQETEVQRLKSQDSLISLNRCLRLAV